MSDLVGNPEDRFCRVAAQIVSAIPTRVSMFVLRLNVEASVVQWVSHLPCGPGVTGSTIAFSVLWMRL